MTNTSFAASIDTETTPKVGRFTISSIQIPRIATQAELYCVSDNGDYVSYPENLQPDTEGNLNPPVELDRFLCPHDCYVLGYMGEDNKIQYTSPFACLTESEPVGNGNKKPELITIAKTTLGDTRMSLDISADNTYSILLSGSVVNENVFRPYTGLPIEFDLKMPETEKQIVYLTLGNKNQFETVKVSFGESESDILSEQLSQYTSKENAEIYSKLLTGTTPSKQEINKLMESRERLSGIIDSDSDGLSDLLEQSMETDPNKTDTDSDGFTDGEEISLMGTDPLSTTKISGTNIANLDQNDTLGFGPTWFTGTATPNKALSVSITDSTTSAIFETDIKTNEKGIFQFEGPSIYIADSYIIKLSESGAEPISIGFSVSESLKENEFIIDSINQFEVPLIIDKNSPLEIFMEPGKNLTIFGSFNPLVRKDEIILTSQLASTGMTQATLIPTDSRGLFTITFPQPKTATDSVLIQSKIGNKTIETIRIPIRVTEVKNAAIQSKKPGNNYYLLAYMVLVGTISIYAFFFHRRSS
jgi:hypothetical protein